RRFTRSCTAEPNGPSNPVPNISLRSCLGCQARNVGRGRSGCPSPQTGACARSNTQPTRITMAFWSWSKTAASNATADSSINWAEGQSPSSVNDSARAMMARLAEYRDDVAGGLVTAGSRTAYTVSSSEVFDSTAHMHKQQISIIMHTTSGASPTLNVDGLGAFPITAPIGTAIPTGTLVQNTPYNLVFSNSNSTFILKGFIGNPF